MDFKPNPAASDAIRKMVRPKLQMAAASLVNYIKSVKLAKGRRGLGDVLSEGESPYSWSGKLRNSVMQRWKAGDPDTQQVGTNYFVGLVQEVGAPGPGVAQPVGKKGLMTIPRSDEAIRHMKGGGNARSFPKPLALIPSTKRTGIFFLVEKKRGGKVNATRTEIHFILARSVRIPPHPWLVPSLQEHGPEMLKAMGAA